MYPADQEPTKKQKMEAYVKKKKNLVTWQAFSLAHENGPIMFCLSTS